jgi:hypothetical protein
MSGSDAPDSTYIEHELSDAISGVLARHERSIVGNWVALVETIDERGKRGLWTFTSPDVMAWDTVGLLTHGLNLQQAQTVASLLAEDT